MPVGVAVAVAFGVAEATGAAVAFGKAVAVGMAVAFGAAVWGPGAPVAAPILMVAGAESVLLITVAGAGGGPDCVSQLVKPIRRTPSKLSKKMGLLKVVVPNWRCRDLFSPIVHKNHQS